MSDPYTLETAKDVRKISHEIWENLKYRYLYKVKHLFNNYETHSSIFADFFHNPTVFGKFSNPDWSGY